MDRQINTLPRTILIYGACVVVAIVLGYMVSNPLAKKNMLVAGGILGIVCSPILLKWYHPLLIFSWNASIVFYFLPGKPNIVFLMSVVGFALAFLSRCMSVKFRFYNDRFLTVALIAFVAAICLTILTSGGIGLRALGSESHGGKKYFFIFGAIVGYFALVSRTIPRRRAMFYAGAFLLSSLTAMLSYPIYFAGSIAYPLFNFFPPEIMGLQGIEGMYGSGGMVRLAGLSVSGAACSYFMLMRYGVRGLLNVHKPWRGLLFLLLVGASMMGGFRSTLLLIGLTFAIQFYLEGLHKTRYLPVLAAAGLALFVLTIPFIKFMPLSVQRTLSVLPVEVDPVAEMDARVSTEWRVDMWRRLWPMIPQYFWQGKGYSIDPVDMFFAEQGVLRGTMKSFEPYLIAGEYHNGGLSVLIGFGIFGLIGFLAVAAASVRILYRHYRRGDPKLLTLNTFFLAHFTARLISFFAVYGSISADMFTFMGFVGLSVALNGEERTAKSEENLEAEVVEHGGREVENATRPALCPA